MPKQGRYYVPLDVTFFEGDGADLSDEGQLLFIRMLTRCKTLGSEGWLTAGQIDLCGRRVADRLAELLETPLVVEIEGRYLIPSWPEWESESESIGQVRIKSDRKSDGITANHVRWHVRRGIQNEGCELCFPPSSSQENPNGVRTESESVPNRVEESREEKSITSPVQLFPTPSKAAPKKHKTSAPKNFPITAEMRDWAMENGAGGLDLDTITAQFLDDRAAKGVQYIDWVRGWQTWIRNQVRWNAERNPQVSAGSQKRCIQKGCPDRFQASKNGCFLIADCPHRKVQVFYDSEGNELPAAQEG